MDRIGKDFKSPIPDNKGKLPEGPGVPQRRGDDSQPPVLEPLKSCDVSPSPGERVAFSGLNLGERVTEIRSGYQPPVEDWRQTLQLAAKSDRDGNPKLMLGLIGNFSKDLLICIQKGETHRGVALLRIALSFEGWKVAWTKAIEPYAQGGWNAEVVRALANEVMNSSWPVHDRIAWVMTWGSIAGKAGRGEVVDNLLHDVLEHSDVDKDWVRARWKTISPGQ
jgi:hypothetical protein